jgi:hypothetical protein
MAMLKIKQALIILASFISLPIWAQSTGAISGKVVNKVTQRPLASVKVSVSDDFFTSTDSAGKFLLVNIATKSYNIVFELDGFTKKILSNVVINSGNELSYNIEMEPDVQGMDQVVINAKKATVRAASLETPLSVQRLTTEEIKSNPGGNFDISKVIQTLPGVGGGQGGGGFRNDIIIRGGAPNENVFYLDGIEIPVINHFQTQGSSGGPQGILNVSFIGDVKLSSSAFDARYDNALSSVFQFKQKQGNSNRLQGNFRLSGTEVATTFEGPINSKTTFLASARRSYLNLLFSLIDLPIRPSYWDFQTKISHQINKTTSLNIIGIGAIDNFEFGTPRDASPDKLYVLNSNPFINQWTYTGGISLKKLINKGFINVALSRNSFDNSVMRYQNNKTKLPSELTLDLKSRETENKLRIDVNKTSNGWSLAYGLMAQFVQYQNTTFAVIASEIKDSAGNIVQPKISVNFDSPLKNFWKMGAFAQLGKRFLKNRLGVSGGIRTDMNTFTNDGLNGLQTLSPRVSLSYVLGPKWTVNATVGRYSKIAPYTTLGFANEAGELINKNAKYLIAEHITGGFEYLYNNNWRFTAEGFYKSYSNVPISVRNGISLSNLGSNFDVLGNEAVVTNGLGRSYGFEFFAQKKLSQRFFGILSYTLYKSEYSGSDGKFIASSWDNRQLLSITWGYKFKRNWELGLKFRYQGGAPFTPFDENASRQRFLTTGQGILDFNQINSGRLAGFNSSDVRIDKKWNFKKVTLDLFLDVTNWYGAPSPSPDSYTFARNADNSGFQTTNGQAISPDGSNAVPTFIDNSQGRPLPTIGLIIEF